MKQLLILLSLILSVISCNNTTAVKTITTKELKTILQTKEVQLLDVRTKKETDLGHLEHAILVDYFNTNFTTIAAAKLDKEKTVYVVCRTGNRSTKAAVLLQNQGFKVINVKGGFNQ